MNTLNNGLDSKRLAPDVVEQVFATYWPQFASGFSAILANNPEVTVFEPREEKDILAEILETTRSMSKRVRTLEERNNTQAISGVPEDYFSIPPNITRPHFYAGGEGSLLSQFLDPNDGKIPEAIHFVRNHIKKGDPAATLQKKVMAAFRVSDDLALKIVAAAQLLKAKINGGAE